MAEAAKILNPTKKVVLPDTMAGCSLADGCSGEGLRKMREQHPNALVATYINCNAETKAESDIIVTVQMLKQLLKPSERQTYHFCTG
jgi:quinolinate synthase